MILFRLKVAFEFLGYFIRRPHRGGHGIHSPFLFSFLQNVLYSRDFERPALVDITVLRSNLLKSKESLLIEDMGAGSSKLQTRARRVRDIAAVSSVSHKYGRLLHRIVNYANSDNVLEMGTCLGLGTLYISTGNDHCQVVTIEGSKSLANKSITHFSKLNQKNITIINDDFDKVLPRVINNTKGFDVIFIDGNHTKEAVLRYFYMFLPFVNTNTVIVLDDIRWSAGMLEAWREICEEDNVRLSVDLFRLGIVFFNEKLQKEHFMIYY